MNLDRNAIDKMRLANGEQPLTDAEFDALSGKQAPVDQKVEDPAKKKEDNSSPAEVKVREMSDEELLELIAQKTGRKPASWDDLKPKPEEIDETKAKEDRETNKFIWGLQNKKIKKEDSEGFVADSKDPQNLVYRQRLQAALAEDPELNEEDFKTEFEEEFGLNAGENTRRHKNGKDTLNRLANDILKSTYASVYGLENEYSAYEGQMKAQKEREAKLKEGALAYAKTMESVKGQLKKITAHFSDTDSYEVELVDDSIDKVIELMNNPEWAAGQILNGYTEEQLKDIAWTTVLKENWQFISMEIAKQHHKKHAAGTKGIPYLNTSENAGDGIELTEAQKTLKALNEKHNPAPAAAN